MIEAAFQALGMIVDPMRLLILFSSVAIGLVIGVIPGLGGVVGLAILVPFTYTMDPMAAFAFLIGMAAVTTTSDTIPAVLFGVPGTSGSAATVMDGYPMAKQGHAGRAFGAAYTASMLGGVFGALLLALSIPIIRPVMLYIGSPELFMLTILGISMVASLSGKSPSRGIAAGAIGIVLSMVGLGSQSGSARWTFDELYLWDGLPLVPITLGLFAIPELVDMAITKSKIANQGDSADTKVRNGQWQGIRDVLANWWLTIRCGTFGAVLGAIPGLGSAVVDWLAYGHAQNSERNTENFGKGDVRGVIAPEAANNAKTGGSLVPTLAFGVPGSASMAILLGAFLMHGLVPGPEMLGKNLDVTYGIIWSLALANVFGAGLCLAFANQFAKVSRIRFGILVPIIMVVAFLGAFQSNSSWGDLGVLLAMSVFGWTMKQMSWPRAPLMLGFVLGEIFERYLWISINTSISMEGSAYTWIYRPVVIGIIALVVWSFFQGVRPLLKQLFWKSGPGSIELCAPRVTPNSVFSLLIMTVLSLLLWLAQDFAVNDRVVPMISLALALVFTFTSFIGSTFTRQRGKEESIVDSLGVGWPLKFARVSLWIAGFTLAIKLIGFLPAILVFLLTFMIWEGKERIRTSLIISFSISTFCYLLFHQGINVNWPVSLTATLFPALRSITGIV